MNYTLKNFETDITSIKPRIFDTYILPGFLMYYAIKSKEMKKNTRRMLFVAGVYTAYRNYNDYKKLIMNLRTMISTKTIL